MNILKKLKLTLLATSVVFFPKAGHAADQEKDDHTALTRAVPASFSSSSQEPEELRSIQFMTSSDATLLSTIVDFDNAMLDFYSPVNEEIMAKIRSVSEGVSSEEFQARADAIKRNFATSIFSTNYLPEEARKHFFDVVKVSARALELPVSEIDARGVAINKMVESLFTFKPADWELAFPKAEWLMNPKDSSLDQFRLIDSAELIDYALALPSQEILGRADVLKKNEEVLLTNSRYSRPEIIKSLFKLEPGENERRATIMPSLIQYVHKGMYDFMGTNMRLNDLIRDVSKMKIDDLERNARLIADRFDRFIMMVGPNSSRALSRLMREILKVNPDDNQSRFDTIERNWGALSTVISFQGRSEDIFGVFNGLFTLSSDEITSRTTALIQNQEHLRQDQRATIFMQKSADEITAIAERNAEIRRRNDEMNQAQMRFTQTQFCIATLKRTLLNLKRTSPHLLFTQLDETNQECLLEKAANLVLAQQYKEDDLTVFEKAYSDLFPSDEK